MTEPNHVSIVELGQAERRQRQGHADMPKLQHGVRSAFVGINASPQLVATLRMIAYIVITLALNIGIVYFTQTTIPFLVAYNVIIVAALRQIEGVLDAYFKPDMNQTESTQ